MPATRPTKLNKQAIFLTVYVTLAGCTLSAEKHAPTPADLQTLTTETAEENNGEYNLQGHSWQEWTELERGQNSGGFDFKTDGSLLYSGKLLAESILVSSTTTSVDGEFRLEYADKLYISPLSPDKEYAIVIGCENLGFCWATYRARLSTGQFVELQAGIKYGIDTWVAWLPPDHAIVKSEVGEESYFFRVYLPASTSVPCEPDGCH